MYLIDTHLHSSNVVNRLYCNSLTTDNAEDERSYKGVIAKDERRMIRIGIYLSSQILQIIGEMFGGMENSLYICGKIASYYGNRHNKAIFVT